MGLKAPSGIPAAISSGVAPIRLTDADVVVQKGQGLAGLQGLGL
jgi:hypothetical protein